MYNVITITRVNSTVSMLCVVTLSLDISRILWARYLPLIVCLLIAILGRLVFGWHNCSLQLCYLEDRTYSGLHACQPARLCILCLASNKA